MSVDKIANRYAKSLFDESMANDSLESTYSDIRNIQKLLSESRDLKNFFNNPIIKVSPKLTVIQQVFAKVVSPKTLRLLEVLVQNKREAYISDITRAFANMYDVSHNITRVMVTTATDVDESTFNSIKNVITLKTGAANLQVTSKIDTTIIGGFIAQVGDRVIDASVSSRLKKVSNELINN